MAKDHFGGFLSSLLVRGARELVKRALKDRKKGSPTTPPAPAPTPPPEPKSHPWRLCPVGQHWVRPHDLKVAVSEKNPDGMTIRNTGCRDNPTRGKKKAVIKDYLHPNEILAIAETHFKDLKGPPAAGKLPHKDSDKYDALIRGWTRYWNEIFRPEEPLDPDLVKALIASESGFELSPPAQNAGTAGKANGFIQLTDQALKALGNPNGELRNHLIKLSVEDTRDANIAICAGIRWIFNKRSLASHKLKREATWVEGIAEYKAYLKDMLSGKKKIKGMDNIQKHYGDLKK
jgi:hypothetical protein